MSHSETPLHEASADPLRSATFVVPAMDCSEEYTLIRRELERLDGVRGVHPNYLERSIRVEFNGAQLVPEQLVVALEEMGFPAQEQDRAAVEARLPALRQRPPWTTWSGGVLLAAAAVARWQAPQTGAAELLCILSAAISGLPIARSAWRSLRLRRVDMNSLMAIAAIGALLIGDYLEAATAMFLFALSLWLESYSLGRARRAVQALVELTPKIAHRLLPSAAGGTGVVDVDPRALAVGDRVLVRPGERLPVDGRVRAGQSAVNEAPLTGESMPVEKQPGDTVYAGSMNHDGSLEIEATTTADESRLAHIGQLVEQAQASRSPTTRFVDRFAARYTPAVIAVAVAVAVLPALLLWLRVPGLEHYDVREGIHRGLVLLVIACPCALVISTPVSILCALQQAARRGIVVKGGEHLEILADINCLAFDKTGTLTEGRPQVLDIQAFDSAGPEQLLATAAALESHSEHPIAGAIVREAKRRALRLAEVREFSAARGGGVQGQVEGRWYYVGNPAYIREQVPHGSSPAAGTLPAGTERASAVWIAQQDKLLGAIRIADQPRGDAAAVVGELRELGIGCQVMLTGDAAPAAGYVAGCVGIESFQAELLPEDKVAAVQNLAREQGRVAMVGDGINDAPALMTATVGIAFGAQASDTALETADIVILAPHLTRLPQLIRLSRWTRRILRQNIAAALGIKLAVFLLATAGIATMWMAVAADVGASLLVIFNGMRLLEGAEVREGT